MAPPTPGMSSKGLGYIVHACVCTCVFMYVYMYGCHVYMCMYIYIVYINIHAHICMKVGSFGGRGDRNHFVLISLTPSGGALLQVYLPVSSVNIPSSFILECMHVHACR